MTSSQSQQIPDHPPRRIVTGVDAEGRSTVLSDGPPDRVASWSPPYERPNLSIIWGYDQTPTIPNPGEDESTRLTRFYPPNHGGSRFVLERFDPGYGVDASQSGPIRDAFEAAGLSLVMDVDAGAGFHATSTVDYGVVLSGRLELVTDEKTVTLEPGDFFVQTGVAHAWRNPFDVPCEIAFVLIRADRG